MMCLPGRVSVWLDRSRPARREKMDDSGRNLTSGGAPKDNP